MLKMKNVEYPLNYYMSMSQVYSYLHFKYIYILNGGVPQIITVVTDE